MTQKPLGMSEKAVDALPTGTCSRINQSGANYWSRYASSRGGSSGCFRERGRKPWVAGPRSALLARVDDKPGALVIAQAFGWSKVRVCTHSGRSDATAPVDRRPEQKGSEHAPDEFRVNTE